MVGSCIGIGQLVVASCVHAADCRHACAHVQYHSRHILEGKDTLYKLLVHIRKLCMGWWLLRLRTVFDFAPAPLPAADPVLHMSAPVRRGAVADARLGLA